MTVAEELRKHADLAIKEGGMYYSGSYLDALAKRAESEQAVASKLRELVREAVYARDDADWASIVSTAIALGVEVDG